MLELADVYRQNGAAAISVLTDEKFFQGTLETLHTLRFVWEIACPLLRKDFIIDESQVYETRAAGADAMLLITAAFGDDVHFASLHELGLMLGLSVLVEVHNEVELRRALSLKDIRLIGINNRNLKDFSVNLANTEHMRHLIPSGICVVAESGIFTAADVSRMASVPVDAILVGEALVTSSDIGARVRELSSVQVRRLG